MPRRRKIEIRASELACFDTLVETLRSRQEFAEFDPANLRVWAYEDYEPTIRNVVSVIRHSDHWLAAHRNEMFLSSYSGNRLFCKRDSTEALEITRPTPDRWIANDWVNRGKILAHKIGGRVLFRDSDVETALNRIVSVK